MKYHEFGPFSTRRSGTWFVLLMSVLSLTIVLAEGDGLLPVFFVLVATVAAEKILYQLGKLESEATAPTANMKLAFDAAMSIPCLTAAAVTLL